MLLSCAFSSPSALIVKQYKNLTSAWTIRYHRHQLRYLNISPQTVIIIQRSTKAYPKALSFM